MKILRKRSASSLFLLFILSSALVSLPKSNVAKAEPNTIVVPDDYLTIGWAIGNASEGDTIFVKKGTYYEQVVVNKPISLIGENTTTTIVDGGGMGNVTEVKVDNVSIAGFTIKDSGTSWPNGGITLGNVKNCFIAGNILTGNRRGIGLFGASNNSISGNILTNNLEGIVLSESSNNSVSGNKITGSHIGFSCGNSFNNEILRNNITNNKDCGIELWFSSKNVIQENNITENTEHGIQLVMSFNNTLRGNRIADSRYNFDVSGNLTELVNDVDTSNTVDGKPIYYWVNERDRAVPSDAGCVALVNCTNITVENLTLKNNYEGVLLAYTTNSTITKNNITNNGCGISVDFSFSNTICGNNITNNGGAGILLGESSNNNISGNNITNNSCVVGLLEASDNRFYHNNFMENMGLIVVPIGDYEPSKNVWDYGYPSGGNYWSGYNGTDNDLDGIGDTSYFIDENNADRYPLMHPWSSLQVHNINTGLGYLTIQEAIDAPETLEGHTIFVDAGTYYEHVVINKSISLIGENRSTTIIDGDGLLEIVNIVAYDVFLSGFTVRNGYRAIVVASNSTPSRYNTIHGCVLRQASFGIVLWGEIYADASGHSYMPSGLNVMEENIIETTYAIELGDSHNNKIADNIIENGAYGIYVDGYSHDNLITGNLLQNIRAGGEALTLMGRNATIIGNTFKANDWGLFIYGDMSLTHHVYHNNFIANVRHVELLYGPSIVWDSGYPSGGNYWSDYEERYPDATEIDGSGIWDTPYVIDEDNQDNYPLLHRYGCIRNLDTNLSYLTIQSAIGAPETLDGHTIFVEEGTYYEHVTINKSISLVGESKETTVIDGNSTGTVVYITANNINISGFTIQNSHITPPNGGVTPSESSGIYVDVSIGNNISQNIITKNTFGIFLSGSGNNILSDNIASLNTWDGIHLDESGGNILADNSVSNNGYNGIRLDLSSNGNTLTGNNASFNNGTGIVLSFSTNNNILTGNNASFNNGTGIRLILSSNNILTDNNVSNNEYGIELSNSDNNLLTGNNASNNRYNFGVLGDSFSHFNNYVDTSNMVDGKPIYYLIDVANAVYDAQTNAGTIYLINSDNITITDLTFTKNRNGVFFFNTRNSKIENVTASNNVFGIKLGYSDKNTLTSNNASNNVYGIWLSQSGNNTLTFNTVRSNDDAGLTLWVYSSNNTISHNKFLSNNEQVFTHQSTNLWDNGVEGNYWSDYESRYPNATEIDDSGIWDTPYIIDENNQDNYPIIPEFPTWKSMLLILIVLTVATAIYRRRLLKTPIH